ncbi:MAG TPA: SusE domain-containing protein, partial [Ferruginibacter sp.]|nr:SusE domain-containing protein [Ferruginibacter sp.]
MKKFLKFFSLAALIIAGFAACEKVDDLPYYNLGNDITLSVAPSSVTPTLQDTSSNVLNFSWTSPKYATDTANYKFIIQIDSAGKNFANPTTKTVMGSLGASYTGGEMNNILLNYGFALGATVSLEARVISSYGNNNEQRTSNTVGFTISSFDHPAILTSENTAVTGTLATAGDHSNTFNWTSAFQTYTGNVTYELQYDAAGNSFASPHSVSVGINVNTISFNQGEMNGFALNTGIAANATGDVEFRIKATTAQGAVSYSPVVTVSITTYLPIQKMYLVGGMQGWDINNPLEMINDAKPDRFNKIFYSYIKLDAGTEFKFAKTPGDWGSAYGNNGASGSGFSTGYNQGGNFQVTSTGIYRLTIDIENNMAWVQQKQVGVVGGMQGWDPSAPIYGGIVGRDKFLILANSSGTDEFKFHDGPVWDNSGPDKARWWGSAGAENLDNDGNGPNIVANASPRTRCIWNGDNKLQLKYELSPAAEMRLVGDGITGVPAWNPGASPQMTYSGNGVWTITAQLDANKDIKFLSGPDWGAFDYEDASGGATSTNTPRAIQWTGGSNFKTPTVAGTYTIVLDEYNQT